MMISKDGRTRVSCATLCRIRREDGRYLLALNQQRLQAGVSVLTPIGGGIHYTDATLLERFNAVPESTDVQELRLFIPPDRLTAYRAWFMTRQGREISPFRELREELVDELAILPTLAGEQIRTRFRRLFETQRVTDRPGVSGEPTHYWIEIFDVEFVSGRPRETLWALPEGGAARWVTRDAIARKLTADGTAVEADAVLG